MKIKRAYHRSEKNFSKENRTQKSFGAKLKNKACAVCGDNYQTAFMRKYDEWVCIEKGKGCTLELFKNFPVICKEEMDLY